MNSVRSKCQFGFPLASFALSALVFGGAAAQDYPLRPIRILIPFPAAGAADTIGRTIGEQFSRALGQPVVIDNRPGAAGRLATEMLAKAEPDGHTLLVGGVRPLAISPALYRKLPYHAERNFLREDTARWARIIKDANIRVE